MTRIEALEQVKTAQDAYFKALDALQEADLQAMTFYPAGFKQYKINFSSLITARLEEATIEEAAKTAEKKRTDDIKKWLATLPEQPPEAVLQALNLDTILDKTPKEELKK